VRKVQRVAAYAVILRDEHILLSRLAKRLTSNELWTLPGGGLEHGEDPRDAVVREVHEETGLDVRIGETAHVYSFHQRNTWRHGRRADAHALRIVYDGWVPVDSPEPHVVEVDGSTMDAAWKPVAGVLDGTVPVVSLVTEVLAEHQPFRMQRVAAYGLAVRGDEVLMVRNSERTPFPGRWTLPGGGIDHGESPTSTVLRELREETGLAGQVGEVLEVTDAHFEGTAPTGRREDFHGVAIVYGIDVHGDQAPRVTEIAGTADRADWVPIAAVDGPEHPVGPVVRAALAARERRRAT
jgi:ADP-ribose pyrophosphatase YjhB (NUDIX family)